jgi:predicted kinase
MLRRPIVVSGDHYVIDGHHRWIALLNLDNQETVPAYVIHAKVLDLIAATKEYPKSFTRNAMESFRSITEAAEKHAVLAYGRMNPPTTGHAKLVDKVHEIAKKHDAHHLVVLSHSQDAKKNPLTAEQKVKHAKRYFPHTNIKTATKSHPTIFHHAAELHKQGYKHLHVIAGADRTKEYHEHLHKYNGHFDKEGHGYKFKSITVHSAGARDPHAKGTEGMSASKMREHAGKGHFHEFKKGVPSHVSHEHAKELYHDVRKGMGHLHEEIEVLSEAVQDSGIFKAVFLAGAPGSGKDIVLKKALQGHGMTEINSDQALQHLTDKEKLDGKMSESEQERRNIHRDKSKSLAELRQRLAIHGRNGLIINSTAANHAHIKKIKDKLEALGYDSKMVFVDASDNVSRNRNVERGQKGGRMIPEKIRAEKWRQAQDARVKLAKEFGGEHYHEFNNDEDLRHNTDADVAGQKTSELDDLHKTVKKFTQQPPKSEAAAMWIHKNVSKLAKMPPGNKKQQDAMLPPSSGSKAKEDADKLGLKWMGSGRYGKDGRVTHFALHDRLIEKQKAIKPPVPKKINEEFEQLFTDTEDSHEHMGLRDYVEDRTVVGESTGLVLQPKHFSALVRGLGVPGVPGEGRFLDLRELAASGKESQETTQEEKVSFGGFMGRLHGRGSVRDRDGRGEAQEEKEIIQEGEPTQDLGGDGGAYLGAGPDSGENIDKNNGGVSTSGPKKTLKQLREKK